jgi:uncharacterized protein YjdB
MVACNTDDTVPGINKIHGVAHISACDADTNEVGVNNGTNEGEIFGNIYVDSVRDCSLSVNDSIILEPTSHFHSPFRSVVYPNDGLRLMWEFWDDDAAADGWCESGSHSEVHLDPGGTLLSGNEGHCVRAPDVVSYDGPGRSGRRSFTIDFLSAGSFVQDHTTGGSQDLQIATLGGPTSSWLDAVVNTDLGTTTYAEADTLDVDVTAAGDSANSSFTNAATPAGEADQYFRFSTRRSYSSWRADDGVMGLRGRALVKLFYRPGTSGSWSDLTNYYSVDDNPLRVFTGSRFGAPTCPDTAQVYQVGMDLMRPDENQSSSPDAGSIRTITVKTACVASVVATLDSSTIDVGSNDQAHATLYDAGSNVITGPSVSWSSSNTGIATVNSSTGLVTAVGAGVDTITATSQGIAGHVALTVDPAAGPTVTSLSVASCSIVGVGKTYDDWILGWTVSGSVSGWTWQIYDNPSNDSTTANLEVTGSSGTSNAPGDLSLWSRQVTPTYIYFWVRYTNGSSFTNFEPLDENPLNVNDETRCIP